MELKLFEKSSIENIFEKEKIEQFARDFLGDEMDIVDPEILSKIITETEKIQLKLENKIKTEEKNTVIYDKYKKAFEIDGKKASMGNIIGARRLGIQVELPESLKQTGDGKKICKIMQEKKLQDSLFGKLNKELAKNLAEKTKHQDALESKAYEKIAERSGIENKQFGVVAEQIIIGFLEGLAIDRPDLGFNITEANAYQDVKNKIDFIIHTKQKRRGVGVNKNEAVFDEKSIGIQFTTNVAKQEHKMDQINKAKKRGVEVDDIVYVELDQRILREAVSKWEKSEKSIVGPMNFLSPEIRKQMLKNLFKGLLNEEQERSFERMI